MNMDVAGWHLSLLQVQPGHVRPAAPGPHLLQHGAHQGPGASSTRNRPHLGRRGQGLFDMSSTTSLCLGPAQIHHDRPSKTTLAPPGSATDHRVPWLSVAARRPAPFMHPRAALVPDRLPRWLVPLRFGRAARHPLLPRLPVSLQRSLPNIHATARGAVCVCSDRPA
jgi:hypothetical protein